MTKNTFTFAVLTFNHEAYILEHLESIRFLINTFGAPYNFNLIVADDGSRDQTIARVNCWLAVHGALFSNINILDNKTNNGTCVNYTRIWPLIESDLFKITAGDDVYSCVNIFNEVERLKHNDFFSGLPLLLIDGRIHDSRSTIFNIVATGVIYKSKKFIARLQGISSINTPSLFCNKKFLKNNELSEFIKSYSVTEDFPMLVKIADAYKDVSFSQSSEIYIYYRRTSGSTYLIRGSDFDLDKLKVFNYMLSREKNGLNRFLLKNRIYCYKLDNKLLKKLLNAGYYLYLFRVMGNALPILNAYSKSLPTASTHQAHYDFIAKKASDFLKKAEDTPAT
ncbi:glycosyltransferase [Pseudomonas sp. E2-15]